MFLFNRNNGSDGYEHLNINEYCENYFGQQNHVLVDVRTQSEYMQGHIPGAINIPLDKLSSSTDSIPKGKPVVVVCASGNRSKTGSKFIVQAGHEKVYNLKGGTMTWMMGQHPIEM